MKKYLRKVTALSLTAALMVANVISVSASSTTVVAGGTTVNTTSDVKVPTYDVIVPTALTFSLDPMNIVKDVTDGGAVTIAGNMDPTERATQIITDKGFVLLNKSDVPIKANVEFTMTLGTGVTLMSTEHVNELELTNTAKECSFEIVPMAGATTIADDGTIADPDYDDAPTIRSAITSTSGNATLSFVLDEGSTRVAADVESAAGFAFQGALNPLAAWTASTSATTGDIRVAAKYTFSGIGTAMYTDASANTLSNTLNVASLAGTAVAFVKPVYPMFMDKAITDATAVEVSAPTATWAVDATTYAVTQTGDLFLSLGVGSRASTISNVKILDATGTQTIYTAAATDYARVATTGAVTVTTTATGGFRSAKLESSSAYILRFTLASGYIVDVAITTS